MARILIVDDTPMVREPIAAILANAGYQTVCADDGAQALTMMAAQAPDLVLLDLAMPGMDGLAVLGAMRKETKLAAIPVILLTASRDKSNILKGAELGVRDYLLKSEFSISDLLGRVRKYSLPDGPTAAADKPQASTTIPSSIAAAGLSGWTTAENDAQAISDAARELGIPLLAREQMMDRLEKAKVKTLPGAVTELLALVNAPDANVADVAAIVRRDPVLSSRMLRVANSAAAGASRLNVLSIEDAVRQVGLTGVRKLVTACSVFQAFSTGAAAKSLLRSWQHSLSVATLMETLTPPEAAVPSGVPYVVGLCHDLPDIVLRQHFCEEYALVLELTRKTGRPQRRIEAAVFGMPYTELVTLMLSRLGLPAAVARPIQEFFAHSAFPQPPAGAGIVSRLLRMANLCSHGLMLAPSPDEPVMPLSNIECRNTFGDKMPALDVEGLRKQALSGAAVLATLSQADAREISEPDIAKSGLRAAYVRHYDHAALDPLHMLLRLCTSEVTVLAELPESPAKLIGYDLLVWASSLADDSSRVMQLADQAAALTRSRLLPVLLLSGAPPLATATIPRHVQVRRLPSSIETIGAFLQNASQGRAAVAA